MILGYNTNGLAHHDPFVAIELLAEIGYRSVAITLDHNVLNPFDGQLAEQTARVRDTLQRHGLRSVVETGARFLLDPRKKHEPTLLTGDRGGRERRVEFLCRAVEIARQLGSDCVSLWSGVLREPMEREAAFARLATELQRVLDFADQRSVTLAFEPEPGMLVATMTDFQQLLDRIDAPSLQLTLDLGHLHCLGETPIVDVIGRWQSRIANVHIEDMRRGVHEHLMFGDGEMDFPPILAALRRGGYQGGLHVELSRHSHTAPLAARQAFQYLAPLLAVD